MDTFFLNELKSCCVDINGDRENAGGISGVMDAYRRIMDFSELARQEGLLALCDACDKLDKSDRTQGFLFRLMMQVVDGDEPAVVSEMGLNMLAADEYHAYEGLIVLMYYKGACLIQTGVSIDRLGSYMQSLMPQFLREILQKKEERAEDDYIKEDDKRDKWVRSLCEDNREVDERDYSIVNQTSLTLLEMSDKEIQTILRHITNDDLVMAMIELPGRVRARIFDNTSTRLARMLAEDVMCKGKVTLSEVEKSCVNIMRTVIKLEAEGEIAHHNLTVQKFVRGFYVVPNCLFISSLLVLWGSGTGDKNRGDTFT